MCVYVGVCTCVYVAVCSSSGLPEPLAAAEQDVEVVVVIMVKAGR